MSRKDDELFAAIVARYTSELLNGGAGWTLSRAYASIKTPSIIGKRDTAAQQARMRLVLTVSELMYGQAAVRFNQPKKSINRIIAEAKQQGIEQYTIRAARHGDAAA